MKKILGAALLVFTSYSMESIECSVDSKISKNMQEMSVPPTHFTSDRERAWERLELTIDKKNTTEQILPSIVYPDYENPFSDKIRGNTSIVLTRVERFTPGRDRAWERFNEDTETKVKNKNPKIISKL